MDKYEKVRVLGSGTYGRAWLVRNKSTKELLVIKEIRVNTKRELEDALAEADILSKVQHDNIVRYVEVIRTSSRNIHIVMEYCDDGDLQRKLDRQKIRRQHFTEEEVVAWSVQVLEALAYLHERGMIHRDVKLANVFCNKSTVLKLGDFGIARVLDANAARMSARTCMTPVGTPMNMAPELCKGLPYGQKADMWALGCVLYELCALKPAFLAQTLPSLMHRIKRGRYDRQLPERFSPALQEAIFDLLALDPSERPSARDLLERPPFCQHRSSSRASSTSSTGVAAASSTPSASPKFMPKVAAAAQSPPASMMTPTGSAVDLLPGGSGSSEPTPDKLGLGAPIWKKMLQEPCTTITEEPSEPDHSHQSNHQCQIQQRPTSNKQARIPHSGPWHVPGTSYGSTPQESVAQARQHSPSQHGGALSSVVGATALPQRSPPSHRHHSPHGPAQPRALGPLLNAVACHGSNPNSPRSSPRSSPQIKRRRTPAAAIAAAAASADIASNGGSHANRRYGRSKAPGRDANLADLAQWYRENGSAVHSSSSSSSSGSNNNNNNSNNSNTKAPRQALLNGGVASSRPHNPHSHHSRHSVYHSPHHHKPISPSISSNRRRPNFP